MKKACIVCGRTDTWDVCDERTCPGRIVHDSAGTELCGICCDNYSTHDIESDVYVGPICDECDSVQEAK